MAGLLRPLGASPPLGRNASSTCGVVTPPLRLSRKLGFTHSISRSLLSCNARRSPLRAAIPQHATVCTASPAQNPFTKSKQMDGLQSALSQLPAVGVYVLGAAVISVLGGAGFTVAQSLAPESIKTAGKAVGAVVGAAAGAYVAVQLKATRQSAAIIELSNLLVTLGDPTLLTRDQVTAIEAKYGTSLAASSLEQLKSLYGMFVEAVIPPGDAPLRGNEHLLIKSFKAALGLTDNDAAPVHIDVGRRILRGRLEAGSRSEDAESRKSFQKLIYVSNLVFGDRQSAFLLPWARVFGLSDATVQVARRDNARALFKQHVAALGGLQPDRAALAELKQYQEQIRLGDEEASAVVAEAQQATLQGCMERAIDCVKRRTRVRDYSDAMAAVCEAVGYNRGMAALQGDTSVPAGLGPSSVAGSAWASAAGRSNDLREVLRVFLEESLASDNAFTDALEADAADLRTVMGLGPKEAAGIEADVKQKAYRRLLRGEVTSGRLDAAPSKAEVLGDLLEKVRFDPDAAKELHRELYKQKLSSLLEKKALTEDDVAELARLQRLLCVPFEERDAMHAEMCGSLFREAVTRAMSAGIDGFGYEDRQAVQRAVADLKLDRKAARQVLDSVGRKYLLQFISASRLQRDRINAAKELKKMVLFSNLVLSPLLDDLKTPEEREKEEADAKAQAEIQELMAKARKDAEQAEKEKEGGAAAAPVEAAAAEEGAAEGAMEATEVEEGAEEAEVASAAEEAGARAFKAEASEARPKSLEKAQAAAEARAGGEKVGATTMRSQKEVTLAADLDQRDRVDIYRNFLLYCMTGDVVQGPMGVQMVTERDDSEFARLSQLGDVLGLSQMDVYGVHQGLAEQAFKGQVQQVMGDGNLTPDRAAGLESVREKMGLPKEAADKIIKGFQNQKIIASMQAAKAAGALTLDKILELKDAGVDPASLVKPDALQQMYRTEIAARLSDGTGDFDSERLLRTLPADLGLDAGKAGRVVQELAGERKRTTLVQAVAFLRQKKMGDAVKSLNNLRSCAAALPGSTSERWEEKDEVADLYSLYCSKEGDAEKRAGIQDVLGLSDADAANLRSIVEAGEFKLSQQAEEEEAAFF